MAAAHCSLVVAWPGRKRSSNVAACLQREPLRMLSFARNGFLTKLRSHDRSRWTKRDDSSISSLPASIGGWAPCRANLQQWRIGLEKFEYMEDVYDALALHVLELAEATPSGNKCLVALAGPPGSGKSTVSKEVVNRVNDPTWSQSSKQRGSSTSGSKSEENRLSGGEEGTQGIETCALASGGGSSLAVAVPMDGFHLYRWQLDCMPDPVQAHARRGAPWTFDPVALYRHLRRILEKGSGFLPSFDHGVGDPVERDIFVDPSIRVVLVEGNYLLMQEGDWSLLQPLFNETWFLDLDIDEAMRRVEKRHIETGKSRDLARYRVENNDRLNALSIMETRGNADFVIPSLPLRPLET